MKHRFLKRNKEWENASACKNSLKNSFWLANFDFLYLNSIDLMCNVILVNVIIQLMLLTILKINFLPF